MVVPDEPSEFVCERLSLFVISSVCVRAEGFDWRLCPPASAHRILVRASPFWRGFQRFQLQIPNRNVTVTTPERAVRPLIKNDALICVFRLPAKDNNNNNKTNNNDNNIAPLY